MAALHLPPLILSLLLCLGAGSPGEPTRRLAHLSVRLPQSGPQLPEVAFKPNVPWWEKPLQYVGFSFGLKAFHFQRDLGL